MSSTAASEPAPPTSTSSDNGGFANSGGLGAATYYGAVAVVIFALILITLVSRVLFTRRAKRLAAARREVSRLREEEERAGMVRRGEDQGLPTYRQSAFETIHQPYPSRAPLSSPPAAVVHDTVAPPPYRPPPPKYNDESPADDSNEGRSRELGNDGQAVDAEDAQAGMEMRQMDTATHNQPQPLGAELPGPREGLEVEGDTAAYERRTRGGGDRADDTVRAPEDPPAHAPATDSQPSGGRRGDAAPAPEASGGERSWLANRVPGLARLGRNRPSHEDEESHAGR